MGTSEKLYSKNGALGNMENFKYGIVRTTENAVKSAKVAILRVEIRIITFPIRTIPSVEEFHPIGAYKTTGVSGL